MHHRKNKSIASSKGQAEMPIPPIPVDVFQLRFEASKRTLQLIKKKWQGSLM